MKTPDDMKRMIDTINAIRNSPNQNSVNDLASLFDIINDDDDDDDLFINNIKNSPSKNPSAINSNNKALQKDIFILQKEEKQNYDAIRLKLLQDRSGSPLSVVSDLLSRSVVRQDKEMLENVLFHRDILNRFFDVHLPQKALMLASEKGQTDTISWLLSKEVRSKLEEFEPMNVYECFNPACSSDHAETLSVLIDHAPHFNPYTNGADLLGVATNRRAFASVTSLCERFRGHTPLCGLAVGTVEKILKETPPQNERDKERFVGALMNLDAPRMVSYAHDLANRRSWDNAAFIISFAPQEDYVIFVNSWKHKAPKRSDSSEFLKSFWDKASLTMATEEQKSQKQTIGPRKM